MKSAFYIFLLVLITTNSPAQKTRQISIAFMNAASDKPFAKFGELVTDIHHPGIEFGYAFNWKTKPKHDLYQEIKLGYFYHRFVQHAIPLYTAIGYRYKVSDRWSAQAAIGIGYMHSIPATAQLKLESNGEYTNAKGIGRMQGLAVFNISGSHTLKIKKSQPKKLFITYQQIIQTPFINAYVPLLPYNSLLLGISIPLKSNEK
ncbi:MAG: hypothetical protein ABIT07_00130 [Ferruginibacter sp.]